MPRVVGIGPQGEVMYETDTGQVLPIAPGTVPELDYEAAQFSAPQNPMLANAGMMSGPGQAPQPPAGIARDPSPPPMATDAPAGGGFLDAVRAGETPPTPRQFTTTGMAEAETPEERSARMNTNAQSTARREGLVPGPRFEAPGAPGPQRDELAYQVGFRAPQGGGGGGPRQAMTMRQQLRAPIDPRYSEEIGEAAIDRDIANEAMLGTTIERANREAEIRQQALRDAEVAQEGRQQATERYQQRVAEQQAAIDGDVERYQRISEDPFAEKSTGSKILAAVAVALGGLGNAIAGKDGPNPAMQVLQQQFADEREAARAKMRAGEGKLAALRDQYGSEQAALDVHEAGLRQRAAMQIENLIPSMADEAMRAQAQQLAAEQRMMSAQAAAQAAQEAAGMGELVTERRSGGGGGRRQPEQVVRVRTQNGDIIEVDAQTALRTEGIRERILGAPEGEEDQPIRVPGLAIADREAARQLTDPERGKLRNAASSIQTARDAVQRLRQLRTDFGVTDWVSAQTPFPSSVVDNIEQERMSLMRAVSNLEEAGALGDAERDYYLDRIGNLTGAGPSSMTRLQALGETLERDAMSRLRGYGYRLEDRAQSGQAPTRGER